MHFVDALLGFEAAAWLPFRDISTEVAVRVGMCLHHPPLDAAGRIYLQAISRANVLVRLSCYGQSIIHYLDISVAPRQTNKESWGRSV